MGKAEKSLREDFRGLVILVVMVLLILFLGYYTFDDNKTGVQETEDIIGKAFYDFQQETASKQFSNQGSCFETDEIKAVPTGFNPFQRGQITFLNLKNNDNNNAFNSNNNAFETISKTDHCKDPYNLIEFSCDQYAKAMDYTDTEDKLWSSISCKHGCNNQLGKCNNEPQE